MIKPFTLSEKGLTLIELLATLTLVGIISVIIASYFSTGLNSFRKVNEEISLHDDANYVMRQFENEILEAISAEKDDSSCGIEGRCELIIIEKMKRVDGIPIKVTLGFNNHQAVINDTPLHTSRVEITDESSIETHPKKNYVTIKLKMKDSSENMVTLENRIPYIKVDQGGAESETGN